MGFSNPALQGLDTALHLGYHSGRHHAITDHLSGLIDFQSAQMLPFLVFHPLHIREQDEFFRSQGRRRMPRHQISVDVVCFALLPHSYGSNDRDEFVVIQRLDEQWVDLQYLSHHTDIDDLGTLLFVLCGGYGHVHLARQDDPPVFPAQPHRHSPVVIDQPYDLLVDLAHQDHLDYVKGLAVRHPHPPHIGAGNSHLLQGLVDLWTSTMDHNGVDTHILEQHHVLGKTGLEFFVHHGVAAVLYDERLPVEAPDIRKRLHQDLGFAYKVFH